jgi:ketosteroid isomerase-like protein
MLKTISILLALTAAAFAQDSARDEAQVWNLEKAYWDYVKANDLEKYRTLWHEDFLGWPYVSSAPTGKDHITDWITANASKGVKLQSYAIEQLAVRVTGDIDQLLSDQGELGHERNSQSANGRAADHAHVGP